MNSLLAASAWDFRPHSNDLQHPTALRSPGHLDPAALPGMAWLGNTSLEHTRACLSHRHSPCQAHTGICAQLQDISALACRSSREWKADLILPRRAIRQDRKSGCSIQNPRLRDPQFARPRITWTLLHTFRSNYGLSFISGRSGWI